MVHVWSINSGERFQGHHGPLVVTKTLVDAFPFFPVPNYVKLSAWH